MIVKVKGKAVKLNGKWCYKGETENITLEQYEGKEKYLEIVEADEEVEELPQVPGENVIEDELQEEKTEVDEKVENEKVENEKVEEENQQEEKQEETEVDEELEALKEKAESLDIKVTANMKKETIIKKIQEKEEDQNQTKNEE